MVTKDRHDDILGAGNSVLTTLNGSVAHESHLSSSETNPSDLGDLVSRDYFLNSVFLLTNLYIITYFKYQSGQEKGNI